MAYTDSAGKEVKQAYGAFQAYAYEACVAGQLVAQDTSNEGFIPADDGDGEDAVAICMVDVAALAQGWFCRAAIIKARDTESSGVWSAGTFFAAGDVTSNLYLGESGLASLTIGDTVKQRVGWVISTSEMYLAPGGEMAASAGSFTTLAVTGDMSIGGNVTVATTKNVVMTKGNLTLTNGAVVHTEGGYTMTAGDLSVTTGNVNISTAGNINLTLGDVELTSGNMNLDSGDVVLTSGNVNLTSGDTIISSGDLVLTSGYVAHAGTTDITATKTLTTAQCGLINVKPAADTVLTLPTAAAGLEYTIIHFATSNNINVIAGSSDYILAPADGAVNDYIYSDSGLDCRITLRAIDATYWVGISVDGDWTGKNT